MVKWSARVNMRSTIFFAALRWRSESIACTVLKPGQWWCSFDAVPVECWTTIEVLKGNDDGDGMNCADCGCVTDETSLCSACAAKRLAAIKARIATSNAMDAAAGLELDRIEGYTLVPGTRLRRLLDGKHSPERAN